MVANASFSQLQSQAVGIAGARAMSSFSQLQSQAHGPIMAEAVASFSQLQSIGRSYDIPVNFLGGFSYADYVDANIYLTARGRENWINTTDINKRNQALVNATDYMDRRWSERLVSKKSSLDQLTEWPRKDYGTPEDIIIACMEYANYALDGPLFAEFNDAGRSHTQSEQAQTTGTVRRTKRRAGPVEIETEYDDTTGSTTNTVVSATASVEDSAGRYPLADTLMHKYLKERATKRAIRN